MKKNLFIALGIAIVMFIYGYFASTVGHDHDSHGDSHVEEEHGHSDHDHDH